MKKITLIAIVALMATMTSCKKDRTCTCTLTQVTPPAGATASLVSSYKKVKKSQAAANCTSYTSTQTQTNGGTTTSYVVTADCKLS